LVTPDNWYAHVHEFMQGHEEGDSDTVTGRSFAPVHIAAQERVADSGILAHHIAPK